MLDISRPLLNILYIYIYGKSKFTRVKSQLNPSLTLAKSQLNSILTRD